ncbi:retrovirus-related pol polyprotein from transposon TNT 1-94 [Tanacetum coccineum]
MHNNIMAAGSRDRPPMLATGRYAQWRSRFLRYIDTRPNGDALRKCILTVLIPNNMRSTQLYACQNSSESGNHREVPTRNSTNLPTTTTNIFKTLRNKNVDTTPRYKNDNQTGQFGNQRAINVVGARETVGSPVVQQSGIQCFNCKEFGHYAKECRKPKRVRDSTYHKETMLLCENTLRKRTTSSRSNLTATDNRMKKLMNKSWKHINSYNGKDSKRFLMHTQATRRGSHWNSTLRN